ncbi:MAG: DUF4367 domain-containing protein [Kineothrix sp.]|nr:DUF4367 domain-containing protein [Kineothrix sp.]
MKKNKEEMLPRIVEDKLQEAYEQIRKGEVKQMKKRKKTYKNWMGAAAILMLVILIPSAVYAAVTYFQKVEHREGNNITYEFQLNYELMPGEYKVTPGYLPEGFVDNGYGKYRSTDEYWITIMPVYTMTELEKINSEITLNAVEEVEHSELSGMPADIITFQEAKKYQSNTYILLFNESEGYVLNIIAGFKVDKNELLKFADSLTVEKIGEGHYETEEEKELREQKENEAVLLALEGQKNWDSLIALGIPEGKIFSIGEEIFNYDKTCSYTITDYEFLDSIDGFAKEGFFDFERFDGWLNGDNTLRPYARMHYDKNGELLEEVQAEQEILRVGVKVHCYDDTSSDLSMDFSLQYVTMNTDGVLSWAEDYYDAVPEENYFLQMDNSAVYFDKAVNTQEENRNHFFYREMKSGEDLEYTLLFVVDKDRKNNFLLYPTGSNSALWQTESMTAGEIREELEGYISLQDAAFYQ